MFPCNLSTNYSIGVLGFNQHRTYNVSPSQGLIRLILHKACLRLHSVSKTLEFGTETKLVPSESQPVSK